MFLLTATDTAIVAGVPTTWSLGIRTVVGAEPVGTAARTGICTVIALRQAGEYPVTFYSGRDGNLRNSRRNQERSERGDSHHCQSPPSRQPSMTHAGDYAGSVGRNRSRYRHHPPPPTPAFGTVVFRSQPAVLPPSTPPVGISTLPPPPVPPPLVPPPSVLPRPKVLDVLQQTTHFEIPGFVTTKPGANAKSRDTSFEFSDIDKPGIWKEFTSTSIISAFGHLLSGTDYTYCNPITLFGANQGPRPSADGPRSLDGLAMAGQPWIPGWPGCVQGQRGIQAIQG